MSTGSVICDKGQKFSKKVKKGQIVNYTKKTSEKSAETPGFPGFLVYTGFEIMLRRVYNKAIRSNKVKVKLQVDERRMNDV
jgi:hypothetical protein